MTSKKEEKKIPQYILKFGEVEELGNTISSVSGSIREAYADISGTFNVDQARMAENTNMGQNIERLVEATERQNRLLEEAQEEAEKQAKTERNRFYISVGIAIVAAIIAIVALV